MTRKLRAGEETEAVICARKRWNDVRLDVTPGEIYQLTARGRWVDLWICSGPEGYPSPRRSWIMHLAEPLRRVAPAPWFALIGAICDGHEPYLFVIGAQYLLEVPRPGRLYGFANDVCWMYWNNWGQVSLHARRLR